MRTAFQLAIALSAMKPLKFGFSTPCHDITTFSDLKNYTCTSISSDYISHYTAIVITFLYWKSYTWQAIVVQSFTRLTWSNIIHAFCRSPPTCMCLMRSTPLPGPSVHFEHVDLLFALAWEDTVVYELEL